MGVPEQVDLLVRARYPILYIITWEEERVRGMLSRVAERQGKTLAEWSINEGIRQVSGAGDGIHNGEAMKTPIMALDAILVDAAEGIYVMKDLHRYFARQSTYRMREELVRKLREMYDDLKRANKTLVITAPALELPTELEKSMYIITLPPPGKEELLGMLKALAQRAKQSGKWRIDLTVKDGGKLVDAVMGLTLEEAERVFVKALVTDSALTADDVAAVREEKEQIVRKSGLLEYCHAEEGIADVGGLNLLKEWVNIRGKAFDDKARAYGLPLPKGVLLLGVQGCGKSLSAKAISALWGFPLLRLDMSRIFSGFIGASEDNMRKALTTAESISPAVLWVDEIEKAFSGTESSGRVDAGTTSRVFGSFLTWLQENRSKVFVVATANSIESLPPEVLRKGRFDEIFFVDLPREEERRDIFDIHIRKRKRDPKNYNIEQLSKRAEGFSGAEIEQAILEAMFSAFAEGREVNQVDVLKAMDQTVPLSVTRSEAIDALRHWAGTRARPTS